MAWLDGNWMGGDWVSQNFISGGEATPAPQPVLATPSFGGGRGGLSFEQVVFNFPVQTRPVEVEYPIGVKSPLPDETPKPSLWPLILIGGRIYLRQSKEGRGMLRMLKTLAVVDSITAMQKPIEEALNSERPKK